MWVVPGYLKMLLLPPANLFALALVGLLFYRRRPRFARALIAISFVGLYVLSTPLAGGWLLRSVEDTPPLTDDRLADD
ncbi:MAG: YdcF family protein, partial [Proteobacteria bacterium]|nr:YdcF family protein [Pseudomonadota bacterium]